MRTRKMWLIILVGIFVLTLGGLLVASYVEEGHTRLNQRLLDAASAGKQDDVKRLLAQGADPRGAIGKKSVSFAGWLRSFLARIRGDDDNVTITVMSALDAKIAQEREAFSKAAINEEMTAAFERERSKSKQTRGLVVLTNGSSSFLDFQEAANIRVRAHMAPFSQCRRLLQEASQRR